MAARTEYQPRFWQPAYLERDRPTPLEIEVYAAGALSAPTSGTISIYNASNTAVVSAAAVTIASSKATYTLAAATVAASAYGMGWRVEWSLVMADTLTYLFRQDGALVRVRLYPVISDADLLARHSDLNSYRPSASTSWEAWILEAWRTIVGRLEEMGRRPYLVISPESLRAVHQASTLAIICRDLSGAGDPTNRWTALAEHYESEAQAAWGRLAMIYDETDTGVGSATRRQGISSVWLTSRAAG